MPNAGYTTAVAGRNSKDLKNSQFSPAYIETMEQMGGTPVRVEFDVVAREGQFSDTTIANYSAVADSTLHKFLLNEASKRAPNFLKGELTTKFNGIQPKSISFDIIYRADLDLSVEEIRQRIQKLQSLCYPRFLVGRNPPLCMLHVLRLYSLEVYVQQVLVNWHNIWDIDQGLPMGADISMSCWMHQYPNREEILRGAGFDSTIFRNKGYSATDIAGLKEVEEKIGSGLKSALSSFTQYAKDKEQTIKDLLTGNQSQTQ